MELTENELHCIARFLQGAVFGRNKHIFDGCAFCKCQCADIKSPLMPQYPKTMRKLYDITGVDTRIGGSTKDYLPPFDRLDVAGGFPYKRFLRNSNDNILERFRAFFNDLTIPKDKTFLEK